MNMTRHDADRMIETYRGARATTYRVRWREGGTRTGRPDVETFGDLEEARRFRDLVELCGKTMPTRDMLVAHGFAYLVAEVATPTPRLSVVEVCQRYLVALAARPAGRRPSASSMQTYTRHLRRYVEPTMLGGMQADAVTPRHIEAWQVELERPGRDGRRPLGVNSIRVARTGLLGPAFRWATSTRSGERDGTRLLDRPNPVPDALLPREAPFRRDILETPEEYALMLAHARAIAPRWADLLQVEAATGLRWCEAITLDAGDVQAWRNRLTVVRHFAAGQVVEGTKTGPGRTVPLPEALVVKLAARTGLLLPAVYGRRWASDGHLWTKLRKRMADDGLAVHVTHHSMRHGIASWWGTCGITERKRDLLLGHAARTVGDRYVQLTESDYRQARDASARLLGLT